MSSSNDPPRRIATDRALTALEDDRLGYGPLARHVAEIIRSTPHDDGFVMAIYGPWGSGKSTFLAFMKLALQQAETSPTVVDFNPWWFSGEEDLAKRFFEQLAYALRPRPRSKWNERLHRWAGRTRDFVADDVAELAVLAGSSPLPFGNYIGMAGQGAKRLKRSPRDIRELKEAISTKLSKRQSHVLVVIDDVDRLAREEIKQLFKVVKSVGDFKNVIYVIALDRKVATTALGDIQGIDGQDYLEKIVQSAFELPLPDRVELRNLFLDGLGSIVGAARLADESRKTRWTNLLPTVTAFLDTPRRVTTLLNALRLSYPLVGAEVSLADLVAIEALHVFEPAMWDAVRRHGVALTGGRAVFR